jgi:hypothetical protein
MKPVSTLASQQRLLTCIGATSLFMAAGVYAYWSDQTTIRLPLYLLQDGSASSKAMTALKEKVCLSAIQQLTPGDQLIQGEFAARLEITSSEEVNNPNIISCKREMPKGFPDLQLTEPGTRLEVALAMLLDETRKKNQHTCPVILITLHATDSNDGRPVDWKNVRNLTSDLVGKCGVLAIFGPTGDLRHQLLKNLPERARVFPPLSIREGVDWAFGQARTQGGTHE